mmetsp:Transcript_82423/g.183098  ORF Transcript_82423/g.183098 Transcript_82423/m.183098 type:complete len:312 (+) Transcript_82423:1-936(+)
MDSVTTQIALFSRLCEATPLAEKRSAAEAYSNAAEETYRRGHYKLSFPGCGVSNGLQGTIFATGLKEQCGVVRQHVLAFLDKQLTVTLNFVGLSRGGIGGLYLAQELSDLDIKQMVLNLLLFDPVPGNFIWMSTYLDLGGLMNANQTKDVSSVRNLGRVVVLYPHEPLPSIAVHAPLIAKFPEGCKLEEDVILGCHQGALWFRPQADTCLAFARIRDFLLENGSSLSRGGRSAALDVSRNQLAEMLASELSQNAPTTRCAHAAVHGTEIVRHPSGQFLNRYHQALLQRLGQRNEPDPQSDRPVYMLDIVVP